MTAIATHPPVANFEVFLPDIGQSSDERAMRLREDVDECISKRHHCRCVDWRKPALKLIPRGCVFLRVTRNTTLHMSGVVLVFCINLGVGSRALELAGGFPFTLSGMLDQPWPQVGRSASPLAPPGTRHHFYRARGSAIRRFRCSSIFIEFCQLALSRFPPHATKACSSKARNSTKQVRPRLTENRENLRVFVA